MPSISAFYGIVIYLHWRDHRPPHFHAHYGERQAMIAIADGGVLAGSLPPRALRLIRGWHRLHRPELEHAWDLACRHEAPGTIEPLP